MRGVVDLGQVLEIQVGIDLRGSDVGMAQQLLHATQITGRFQDMAGETVPQHVRVHVLEQALALRQLADADLHRALADRPVAAGKYRRGRSTTTFRAPRLQCRPRRPAGGFFVPYYYYLSG